MSDTLLDISSKIEPQKAGVLAAVDHTAKKAGIQFFIVGAAARDFILQYTYEIRPTRATLDVDIGVRVSSWAQYKTLIDLLQAGEHFETTGIEHRFVSPQPYKTFVDILPFGAIEKNRIIHWQHDKRAMNMAGFNEACASAVNVKIATDPVVTVKTVSLAGLALLKLISWNDNPDERDRDAKDFKTIMYHYNEVCSTEYVFDENKDISSGGDFELTIARIFGRDIKKLAGREIGPFVIGILNRESDREGPLRFIQNMQERAPQGNSAIPRDIEMLNAVTKGVADSLHYVNKKP
jgi:predicted nucleotidyltransferase